MRTLVFIPAWNEEGSIVSVIDGVREALPGADLLVVDDGSTDETRRRALAAGVRVATLPFNQGVGAAQQTGYMYALRNGYEICAHLDGDGQHIPSELARLVKEVEGGSADMVVGSRYSDRSVALDDDYQASVSRRTGQHLFRLIVSLSTRQRFTDTTSGMRAVNRSAMQLFSDRYSPEFAEVESVQRAVLQGLRVEELPVRMLSRAEGRSFLTPVRSGYYIFKTLVVLLVGQFRPRVKEGAEMLSRLIAVAADEPVVRLTSQARIVAAILAIAFMAMILELIRRHKLQERYSVIWFVAGIAMLAGAAFPDLLRILADLFGVRDVTIALFSLLFLLLLGLALSFSVIISRQAEQITRLAQEQALEGASENGASSGGDAGEASLKPEEQRLQG